MNHYLKEHNLLPIFTFLILPQQNKYKTRSWKLWGRRSTLSSCFPINWDTRIADPSQSQIESAFEVPHTSGTASDLGSFILLSPWKCNHYTPQYSAMSFKERDINLNCLTQTSYLNLCLLCPDLKWATGRKQELFPLPL